MVALYNGYVTPFIIMFTVPVAVVGALGALAITHQTLNLFSLIGSILLVGLVAKNGILLVDFANQLRERGLDETRGDSGERARAVPPDRDDHRRDDRRHAAARPRARSRFAGRASARNRRHRRSLEFAGADAALDPDHVSAVRAAALPAVRVERRGRRASNRASHATSCDTGRRSIGRDEALLPPLQADGSKIDGTSSTFIAHKQGAQLTIMFPSP